MTTDQIIIVVGLVIGCAAAVAALYQWRAAVQTQRTQVILELMKLSGSREMLLNMRVLCAWKETHGEDFARKFLEARRADPALSVDHARREFKHFIYVIACLHQTGVPLKFLKLVTGVPSISLFLEVVQPMELAIRTNCETWVFDWCRKHYDGEFCAQEGKFLDSAGSATTRSK